MTAAVLSILLAVSPDADDRLAVLAVADPPGPEPELVELTHQLRAACRDRAAGVLEVAEMRARLLGQSSSATLAELERAYAGAMATYQSGEYRSTLRTLRAIVDDLERIPESRESYAQWIRAHLRLAHTELTVGNSKAYRDLLERVAAVEPRHQPDADQFSPTFRRDFDAARARVAARPRRRLGVTALGGWSATVYVNGKPMGPAPATVSLPAGRYRVGGSADALRVPSVWIELGAEDRQVVLDFALAEAVRVNAGPGLAAPEPLRPAAVVGAGAWLGAGRVLAASIASEDRVQFLVGSLLDVRRGALLRQGRVRMVAGTVPGSNVAALAAFLLTGQPSDAVVNSTPGPTATASATPTTTATPTPTPTPTATPTPTPTATATGAPPRLSLSRADRPVPDLSPAPPAAAPRPRWVKPAAYASGALALGLGALATQQGLSARSSYSTASGLLRSDGTFADPSDVGRYRDAVSSGDAARRNAWIGAVGAVAFAATAGWLGYLTWTDAGSPAVRF